jgi:hypothetical protein
MTPKKFRSEATGNPGRRVSNLEYGAARLFLMIEGLAEGRIDPGPSEASWAREMIEDLDIPEETLDQAALDHDDMTGAGIAA